MKVLRHAQKVDPRAKVWIPEAVAKRKGVLALRMPAVPPNRKPAMPESSY